MITIYNESGKILYSINASKEVVDNIINSELVNGNSYIEAVYDPSKYYIENQLPILIPEKPLTGLYTFDYCTKQWIRNVDAEIISVGYIRKDLLQASDWTDTFSAVERLGQAKYQEWQTYRQALRDITLQANYPLDVIWPIAP